MMASGEMDSDAVLSVVKNIERKEEPIPGLSISFIDNNNNNGDNEGQANAANAILEDNAIPPDEKPLAEVESNGANEEKPLVGLGDSDASKMFQADNNPAYAIPANNNNYNNNNNDNDNINDDDDDDDGKDIVDAGGYDSNAANANFEVKEVKEIDFTKLFTSCVYDVNEKNYLKMPWDLESWWQTVNRFTKAQRDPPKNANDLDNFTKTSFFKSAQVEFPDQVDSFINVFHELCLLILNVEELFNFKRVPLLCTKTCGKVVLTRKQVACLIALSFFGDYPIGGDTFNIFNVRQVLLTSNKPHVLNIGVCYMNYLTNIGNWLKSEVRCKDILEENVTYMRHSIQMFPFKTRKIPLCDVRIIESGSLSRSKANFHVDFANKFIGGGALQGGCVQEELMFAMQPELACAMAFMEVMDPTDAILIDNTLCHSFSTGYGNTFKFDRNALPTPDLARKKKGSIPKIIAMDAIIQGNDDQFREEVMHRDIHKAFVCFQLAINFQNLGGEGSFEPSIATGNWGCGAFGGDHELKFMEQWISASLAGVSVLEYYAYGSPEMNNVIKHYDEIKTKCVHVKGLFSKLLKCSVPGTVVNIANTTFLEEVKAFFLKLIS